MELDSEGVTSDWSFLGFAANPGGGGGGGSILVTCKRITYMVSADFGSQSRLIV